MKDKILSFQKYSAISKLLAEYSAVFASNPEDLDAKTNFISKVETIGSLLTSLMKPVSPYYKQQKETRQQLRSKIGLALKRAMSVATVAENTLLFKTFQEYNTTYLGASAFRLKLMSQHINELLTAHAALAGSMGLSTTALTALLEMTAALEQEYNQTSSTLSYRKVSKIQMKKLLSEVHLLLRYQLDSFVKMQAENEIEFYTRYMALRAPKKGKSKASEIVLGKTEITGTIIDSVSGKVVEGAVVNILEYSIVTDSDEDGYFLIDELQSGHVTLTCHAPGYQVPAPVLMMLGTDESLEINFSLVPLAAAA